MQLFVNVVQTAKKLRDVNDRDPLYAVATFREICANTGSGIGAPLITSASVPPSINSRQIEIAPSCTLYSAHKLGKLGPCRKLHRRLLYSHGTHCEAFSAPGGSFCGHLQRCPAVSTAYVSLSSHRVRTFIANACPVVLRITRFTKPADPLPKTSPVSSISSKLVIAAQFGFPPCE